MKRKYLNILLLLFPLSIYSQNIEKTLIFTDHGEQELLKTRQINFDLEGNYCFEIEKDKEEYLLTAKDTLGPFDLGHRSGTSTGGIDHSRDKHWYYKNDDGAAVHGPIQGDLIEHFTSHTKNSIGLKVGHKKSTVKVTPYFLMIRSRSLNKMMNSINFV